MQNGARLIWIDASDEEAIGLADDPLREFRAFGGRLAGRQDHLGEPVAQSAVVIELGEVQILVRQCAQPFVGLARRQDARRNGFQDLLERYAINGSRLLLRAPAPHRCAAWGLGATNGKVPAAG